MFIQFFGSYLLSKGAVSAEQLIDAIEKESSAYVHPGALAMHAGMMSSEQIEDVRIAQTHNDKNFEELCVEKGYLTKEQVDELLASQYPRYLSLGQILVENGVFDESAFHELLASYIAENQIKEKHLPGENGETIHSMLEKYCAHIESPDKAYHLEYLNLFLNNLVRFIGDDFTLLRPVTDVSSYTAGKYASQHTTGIYDLTSVLDMSEDTAIAFAGRYVSEQFDEFDEIVQASIEDFLNLHNGLFHVNMSNSYAIELGLEPPTFGSDHMLNISGSTYIFPVLFPFGIVNILLQEPLSQTL